MHALAIALLVLCCAFPALAKPQRIVSANLCADQLVLALANPSHIAAISFNARDPALSYYYREAARLPAVKDNAEQIMALRPDLVIMTPYGSDLKRRLLVAQGAEVQTLSMPQTIAQIRMQIIEVAGWLGEEARGRQLLADFDIAIARARAVQQHKPMRIGMYYQNGYTDGSGSLMGELITAVGGRNIAQEKGISGMGYMPLEALVANPPDLLLLDRYGSHAPTLGDALFGHPALQKSTFATLDIPASLLICGNHLYGEIATRMAKKLEMP